MGIEDRISADAERAQASAESAESARRKQSEAEAAARALAADLSRELTTEARRLLSDIAPCHLIEVYGDPPWLLRPFYRTTQSQRAGGGIYMQQIVIDRLQGVLIASGLASDMGTVSDYYYRPARPSRLGGGIWSESASV